jgi:outer membrane protein
MKKIAYFLSFSLILSLVACNKPAGSTPSVSGNATKDSLAQAQALAMAGSKVMYVNLDSLQERYTWFKQKNEALMQRQRSAENAMESKAREFQSRVLALQQKAQQGNTPPAQLQQEEQTLGAQQQSLAGERDRKAKELADEATKFNDELRKRIKDVLAQVQKQKGYDYVISYSDNVGSQFWYVNPSLDITSEVLDILNAQK